MSTSGMHRRPFEERHLVIHYCPNYIIFPNTSNGSHIFTRHHAYFYKTSYNTYCHIFTKIFYIVMFFTVIFLQDIIQDIFQWLSYFSNGCQFQCNCHGNRQSGVLVHVVHRSAQPAHHFLALGERQHRGKAEVRNLVNARNSKGIYGYNRR